MTGGKRPAEQGRDSIIPNNSRHTAAFSFKRLRKNGFSNDTTHPEKLIWCHCLKTIRHFETEAATILLDQVLRMETRRRVRILPIEQIVDCGRKLEVFDQILAVKREVDDA